MLISQTKTKIIWQALFEAMTRCTGGKYIYLGFKNSTASILSLSRNVKNVPDRPRRDLAKQYINTAV